MHMLSSTPESGSSPHKWGIRLVPERLVHTHRFIPTQVGNTSKEPAPFPEVTVHPHTSGEYAAGICLALSLFGSSPHKWGIPLFPARPDTQRRFIPTQVGNTSRIALFNHAHSVHPHTSGEYLVSNRRQEEHVGSSPHKWGIHGHSAQERPGNRFIPTQVGNTSWHSPKDEQVSVHPHTSGEYANAFLATVPDIGSSPHKWGIHYHLVAVGS